MSRLLVCDLDGTLLGDAQPLETLLNLLRKPNSPLLAFASGRQGFSAMTLLTDWTVHVGEYLIAGVGSELYRRIGKHWLPVASWPHMNAPWEEQRVRRELDALEPLERQPLRRTSPYKLSYFAPPEAVSTVEATLRDASIEATIVHSHGNLLDVLPSGIDKGTAARWLARRLGITLGDMLTCGNTENDLAMLGLDCPSVIVGDSSPELVAYAPSLPQTYVARAACAGGIIEGLEHFGWLRDADWVP